MMMCKPSRLPATDNPSTKCETANKTSLVSGGLDDLSEYHEEPKNEEHAEGG